jgi:hypothetical protein
MFSAMVVVAITTDLKDTSITRKASPSTKPKTSGRLAVIDLFTSTEAAVMPVT